MYSYTINALYTTTLKLVMYYNTDMTNIAIMYHALITPRRVIKERGFAPPLANLSPYEVNAELITSYYDFVMPTIILRIGSDSTHSRMRKFGGA